MVFEKILTKNWYFSKEKREKTPQNGDKTWQKITLPHTWNALDGQDGGGDYHRGECFYFRTLHIPHMENAHDYLLLCEAACYDAVVYCNGSKVTRHKGGYSAFEAILTPFLKEGENELLLSVSNAPSGEIYPQMADFTFYGGLTRPVTLRVVPETRFDSGCWCASGLSAWSEVKENGDALLHLKSDIKNPDEGDSIRYTLSDGEGVCLLEAYIGAKEGALTVPLRSVHLWQGIHDPYLYHIKAELFRHNEVLDTREVRHGFRFFRADPKEGFFLNGKPYPLRGVSRHGDKLGLGTALSFEDHEEDAAILRELGASCVRLAHYQHDERFLDLCDRYGFVVWAEIPFISRMMKAEEAHENAMMQLNELIHQQKNHPSICFWGISNEITIGGDMEGLADNLKTLNELCHTLDPTRLTAMAQVSLLPMESEQNHITDIVAYNHYFGWYGGKFEDNEAWLDAFHEKHPDRPLGLSEYGCEGILTYQTDTPKQGDYSEAYQALYHEHMLRVLAERPWILCSFVWNLFDFGCDMRDEGGVMGRNNKGLITFDRKLKKDAFYLYKAYWSESPVTHLCGKRQAKRTGNTITVKAYSNESTLILSVNGMEIDKRSSDHVFLFEIIPVAKGYMTVSVRGEHSADAMLIEIVDEIPAHYALQVNEESPIINWFDGKNAEKTSLTFKEGFYSVRHAMRDLLANDKTADILLSALASLSGMKLKASQLMMFGDTSPEEMMKNTGFGKQEGLDTENALAILNAELQRIPLPKTGE